MSRITTPSQTRCQRQQLSHGHRKCRSATFHHQRMPVVRQLGGHSGQSGLPFVIRRPVHLQESTSFFTRKKTMSVPPKKITGIIDGMKHVYFSKVQNQQFFSTG
jgi:hypothetical protein